MMKLALLLFAASLWAQDPTPAFEAVSVKVLPPGNGIPRGCKPDPAILHCTSATLRMLLLGAYRVKFFQVEGPEWIDAENYEVTAKIPEGASPDKLQAMMRTMLAQRFAVKVRQESRTVAGYELTIAKGGPKLTEAEAAKLAASPAGVLGHRATSDGGRTMQGNVRMSDLAEYLAAELSRPVVDRTGLKGTYAIELAYRSQDLATPAQGDSSTPIATLFQAVEHTLGLKLSPTKVPIEMVVVESANKVPTDN
jgi:uncharacterized protein (TIGR03435 family)